MRSWGEAGGLLGKVGAIRDCGLGGGHRFLIDYTKH